MYIRIKKSLFVIILMFLFIFVVSNIGLLITIILNNNSNKKNKKVAQYTLHDEQEACFECKDKKQATHLSEQTFNRLAETDD